MPSSIPTAEETIAKYCQETGEDPEDVRRRISEFAEKGGNGQKITNPKLAAFVWVRRQGKEPPPSLASIDRCFFDEEHWEPAEIHENPDGSIVVLCKRHKAYLCKGKAHGPSGVWVIGEYGFPKKNSEASSGYDRLWFCEEHKPPKRKDLDRRKQKLKATPYTPPGWRWDSQRGVLIKI